MILKIQPTLLWLELKSNTKTEVKNLSDLENRFGSWARIYASSIYLLTQVMRIGTILFLMALVPNLMFGWSIVTVIIFTSVVVMIYSILGMLVGISRIQND